MRNWRDWLIGLLITFFLIRAGFATGEATAVMAAFDRIHPNCRITSLQIYQGWAFIQATDGLAAWNNLFHKTNLGWQNIRVGGGAPNAQDLHHYHGVPLATARRLLAQPNLVGSPRSGDAAPNPTITDPEGFWLHHIRRAYGGQPVIQIAPNWPYRITSPTQTHYIVWYGDHSAPIGRIHASGQLVTLYRNWFVLFRVPTNSSQMQAVSRFELPRNFTKVSIEINHNAELGMACWWIAPLIFRAHGLIACEPSTGRFYTFFHLVGSEQPPYSIDRPRMIERASPGMPTDVCDWLKMVIREYCLSSCWQSFGQ